MEDVGDDAFRRDFGVVGVGIIDGGGLGDLDRRGEGRAALVVAGRVVGSGVAGEEGGEVIRCHRALPQSGCSTL